MARYRDMNTGAERVISGRAPGYPWQRVDGGKRTSKAATTAKKRQAARTNRPAEGAVDENAGNGTSE